MAGLGAASAVALDASDEMVVLVTVGAGYDGFICAKLDQLNENEAQTFF